jgi:hypothetical protein
MLQYEIFLRLRYYLLNFHTKEAARAAIIFKNYFIPNYKLSMVCFSAKLCAYVPFLGNFLGFFLQTIKKALNCFRKIKAALTE